MSEDAEGPQVDVAICIDREVYGRFWEVIRHLCVGLVDLNARVRLLSPSPQIERLTLGPIQTIVHEPMTWPVRRQRMRHVIDTLSARRPTVVHALSADSYWAAREIARTFEIDLVLTATGLVDLEALDQMRSGEVQHLIAASGPLYERAARLENIDAGTTSVVRPGVLKAEGPTCFVRPDRTPSLLCTSDLTADNGVGDLVRAMRKLRDRKVECLLFFSGAGDYENELRKTVRDEGVSDFVTFARPRADKSSVLAGADIWVSPAPEAAITSSSLLAMATGTAVVTCAHGVTDHCLDGKTAVVCQNNVPATLAEGIASLVEDPTRAREIARTGMEHMRAYHGVSAMAEQTMEVYRRLKLRQTTYRWQQNPDS